MHKIRSLLLVLLASLLSLAMPAVNAQEDEITIYPVSYQLNAVLPDALTDFYIETMGMTLIEEAEGYYRLGTSEVETLLEIFQADSPRGQALSTGLYHTAYLYSSREFLGSHLTHLFNEQAPIEGFTYHIVSDAVYAADPEGNGIELYWDYPVEDWLFEDDGQITMGNEPLDYIELMNSAEEEFEVMDEHVKIGHFHLVASDLDEAGDFYANIFNFKTTSYVEGDTHFQASGDYHHHIANNVWFADQGLIQPEDGQQGLRATVWETTSLDVYEEIKANLARHNISYAEEDNSLSFKDASGLGVIVQEPSN